MEISQASLPEQLLGTNWQSAIEADSQKLEKLSSILKEETVTINSKLAQAAENPMLIAEQLVHGYRKGYNWRNAYNWLQQHMLSLCDIFCRV